MTDKQEQDTAPQTHSLVGQAREIAAAFYREVGAPSIAEWMLSGKADQGPAVQCALRGIAASHPAPHAYGPRRDARGYLGITKEWFERRAKAEADLEIGAGFSIVNPTEAGIAQMEVLAERALPQWAQDELARLRAALAATAMEASDANS